MKKFLLLIIGFFLFTGSVFAFSIPQPVSPPSPVNDFANVLSPQFEEKLHNKLVDYDNKTTNQIAVTTVKTTEGASIEEFAVEMAQTWGIGVKGKDNGVLLLFAMDDRKMRIEVGRGLEGDVTDLESKHIIDDIIVPKFKEQKYEEGVDAGVDAVILAIATTSAETTGAATDGSSAGIVFLIILVVVVILIIVALSPYTPLGGEGDNHLRGVWVPKKGSKWGERSFGTIEKEYHVPIVPPIFSSSSHTTGLTIGGGSFGGFKGGSFSGGGASGGW